MTDIAACRGLGLLKCLYRIAKADWAAGWDNLPRESSRCQKNAQGRTWSIGKLGAGINCAKLAIRARSRPIFRRCSIFIRLIHWQN